MIGSISFFVNVLVKTIDIELPIFCFISFAIWCI